MVRDGCQLGSVPPQLRVCFPHGPKLFSRLRREADPLPFTHADAADWGRSGIPAVAAGTAFLSFRIHAAFRHLPRDCLKAQKPEPPGQRRGVGKRRAGLLDPGVPQRT